MDTRERRSNDAALAVLRRVTLVAGEPFEGFEPAAEVLMEFHRDAEAREFLADAIRATPWNSGAKLKLARISQGPERTPLALALAGDPSVKYADRAQAAILIVPARISQNGEMALLASGDKSPEAARKPFFVEARIAAADGASAPAEKLSLLREALEIAPENQTVRIAAVRAALDASRDETAIAMFRSAAPQTRFRFRTEMRANDPRLVESLSKAAERTGDIQAALEFIREAIPLEPAGAGRRQMEQERDALERRKKLRAENAARAPVISTRLDQPQRVRPRETQ